MVAEPSSQAIDAPAPGRTLRLRGDKLRELRVGAGWTREALSRLSKGPDAVSVATLKRAERGEAVYASTAASIARLLGAPLDALLTRAPGGDPSGVGDKAAIAVLPFVPIAGGQDAQVFADGLMEDVIHRLGRCWFPVIPPSSTLHLPACPAQVAGRSLNADYLVRGSVRVEDQRVRVTASLIDADCGVQLWSNWYEDAYHDVLALQDRLTADIVNQVSGEVLEREVRRRSRLALKSLDAWELSLRGLWHFHRPSPEHHRLARQLMAAAQELDPGLAVAHFVPILTLQHDVLNQWTSDAAGVRAEMCARAIAFEKACPQDPLMHVACAYASVSVGARAEAIARLEESLDLDPNSALAHGLYGQALAMGANADQGLHELELARRLSPRDPRLWTVLVPTALAHFAAGRYAEATHWGELALRNRPEIPFAYAALAASHAQLGDLAAARAVRARAEARGQLNLAGFSALFAATEAEIVERFSEGLRRAGY
jgi:adenylate cyclase